MANPLTDKRFVRLLDDRLTKLYTDEYNDIPAIKDQMFKVMKSTRAWDEFMSIGGVPDPEAFNGLIQYQSVYPGYVTKIETREYAGGISVQRRLFDTDRYAVVADMAKGLGAAMKRKMNKIAHEPFMYFDSTAFTFMTNDEGVALCSNSHSTKVPNVSTATGFDNLATLGFDATNLEALRIQSKGIKNDIGERVDTNFDTIAYSTSLAADVWEVNNSTGKTGDNLNNANFQKGRWKTIELPLLDDLDTNDWFIIDSKKMKEWLIWIDSIAPEFANTQDFDTFVRKYSSYCVCGWGFTNWRWIIGSSVS